jgi:hypothetical protein
VWRGIVDKATAHGGRANRIGPPGKSGIEDAQNGRWLHRYHRSWKQ